MHVNMKFEEKKATFDVLQITKMLFQTSLAEHLIVFETKVKLHCISLVHYTLS